MTILERLRSAYEALRGIEDSVNMGHRYRIRTMDEEYYADEYRLDLITGNPVWLFHGPGYELVCTRIDNAVIFDYEGDWS